MLHYAHDQVHATSHPISDIAALVSALRYTFTGGVFDRDSEEQTEMTRAVVLFDGVCTLCTWSVQFILRRDPNGYFHFAALQSPIGQQLLHTHGLSAVPLMAESQGGPIRRSSRPHWRVRSWLFSKSLAERAAAATEAQDVGRAFLTPALLLCRLLGRSSNLFSEHQQFGLRKTLQ